MGRSYHVDRTIPADGAVWVYGSNLAGIHGKGAAEVAVKRFGAKRFVGQGRVGQSYGIATKDGRGGVRPMAVLPIAMIKPQIDEFIEHARAHQHESFFVTRVGCELAGYGNEEIAVLFKEAPANCSMAMEWRAYLEPNETGPADARNGEQQLLW